MCWCNLSSGPGQYLSMEGNMSGKVSVTYQLLCILKQISQFPIMVNKTEVISRHLNVYLKNSLEMTVLSPLIGWTDLDTWGRPLTVGSTGVVTRGWHTSARVIFPMPTCKLVPAGYLPVLQKPQHAEPHQATSRLNNKSDPQGK